MNEKVDSTERFRASLVEAGYPARPSVVEREFNLRWYGRSISAQAAWSWLNAKSIPSQDKVQALSEWLKVEPHFLRFGSRVREVNNPQKPHHNGHSNFEQKAVEEFLKLPEAQRRIVREVIFAFANAFPVDPARKIVPPVVIKPTFDV